MSPTTRASRAMSRADSIRQIASIARCASAVAGSMASAPSHSVGLEDLPDLKGVAVEGCPLEPLDGLVHRAHLPQPIPAHELLGLREWPVDNGSLLAVEPNTLALRARVEAAIANYHPRLDQLLVEPLELRHCLWRRRSEEHTSELQSRLHLVCRLLLEKKKKTIIKLRPSQYPTRTHTSP